MLKALAWLVVFAVAFIRPLFGDTGCAELEGASLDVHLSYLQRERTSVTSPCVSKAVYEIAQKGNPENFPRYGDALKSLVSYLDYRLPEEQSKYLRAVSSNVDPYPASNALGMIGRTAVPEIVASIGSSGTTDVARQNGIWTLFIIFVREDIAMPVRVLKKAAKTADDFETSQRFLRAAQKASEMCKGPSALKCRDALYEPDEQF